MPASPSHTISIATGPGERPETGISAAPSCTGSAHTGSLPAETAILPAPAPQDMHAHACASARRHQWPWAWMRLCLHASHGSVGASWPRPPHTRSTCRYARRVSRRAGVHACTRVCPHSRVHVRAARSAHAFAYTASIAHGIVCVDKHGILQPKRALATCPPMRSHSQPALRTPALHHSPPGACARHQRAPSIPAHGT